MRPQPINACVYKINSFTFSNAAQRFTLLDSMPKFSVAASGTIVLSGRRHV